MREILAEFAERLKELQEQSGSPSFAVLEELSAESGHPLPPSTTSDKLRGASMPEWTEFVGPFVEACVRYADEHGIRLPEEARSLSRWEAVHQAMTGEADRLRDELRLAGPARGEVRRRAEQRRLAVTSAGGSSTPVAGWDPFLLGVHRAMELGPPASAPGLTAYLTRPQDRRLDDALTHLERGVLVMVTGGSSTGKTRTCYEAVVRHCPDWTLLAPADGIELLDHIAVAMATPRCVLWLDDAEVCLDSAAGPAAAAALRQLVLTAPHPAVVIGSMWTEYWAALTRVPQKSEPDEHRQVRRLLTRIAVRVTVPNALTDDELRELPDDPRLVAAARVSASDQRVIQTLAGGRTLVARVAEPEGVAGAYGKAVLTGAMMVHYLGLRSPLPKSLLRTVAEPFVDVVEPPRRWFAMGLSYATQPVRGIEALASTGADSYRLADYLAYHGQQTWTWPDVPEQVWRALATADADRSDLVRLALTAERLFLFRIAAQLYRRAAEAGDPAAMNRLGRLLNRVGHREEARRWMDAAADAGDGDALYERAVALRASGDDDAGRVSELAADAGNNFALLARYGTLKDSDPRRARACLAEAADNGHPIAVYWLALEFLEDGDSATAQSLLLRVTEHGQDAVTGLAVYELTNRAPRELERWLTNAAKAGDRYAVETMALYLDRTRQKRRKSAWLHDMALAGNTAAMVAHEWTSNYVAWLTKAAEGGNADAMEILASMRWGTDRRDAEKWLARAAETGRERPMDQLLTSWKESGRTKEAHDWLRRNAERGNFHAMVAWGQTLLGTGRDAEGLRWLRRACVRDPALAHVYGRYWLGDDADRMEQYGLEPDGSVAAPW
jgi:TPR repeat protein